MGNGLIIVGAYDLEEGLAPAEGTFEEKVDSLGTFMDRLRAGDDDGRDEDVIVDHVSDEDERESIRSIRKDIKRRTQGILTSLKYGS